MSWVATSPYGPQRDIRWMCFQCPSMTIREEQPADPDASRAAAVAHLEATGHMVTISRGTLETLYPMATTPPEAGRS